MPECPVLKIALPTPLRRLFEYLPPNGNFDVEPMPGMRVSVPFGSRTLIGFIISTNHQSSLPVNRLKRIKQFIDKEPVIPESMIKLYLWSARYYHHPVGEAFSTAIPTALRKGHLDLRRKELYYRLTDSGKALSAEQLKRAPRQREIVKIAAEHADGASQHALRTLGLLGAPLKSLLDKGLLESKSIIHQAHPKKGTHILAEAPLTLNPEQQHAVDAIGKTINRFCCFLLEGVTGSGKTEIYLQVIERVLQDQKSALVLVPEIGLTPQTVNRFKQRFNAPIALLHSGRSDNDRMHDWMAAAQESGFIVIGTRSSVFTPIKDLGVIIIDEEHDLSFKQQDGMHYSARDLGITRAHQTDIPIILGSATPSLESLHNCFTKRYRHLSLSSRAGNAVPPALKLIDIRSRPLQGGLSQPVIEAVSEQLDEGNQVLIFINQRGFAPVLMCHQCSWIAQCSRCDTRLTLHSNPTQLRCHHCGVQRSVPRHCPECTGDELKTLGVGTECSEQAIGQLFPNVPVLRIDRDSTSSKYAMKTMLAQINSGEPCVMVGTQMLAKGHHFPKVTLVAILEADYGLFSSDFRGLERMGQLITQVSGRAGREEQPGEVLIQTHQPEHPLLNQLIKEGYSSYSRALLEERRLAQLPPFCHTVLFRAESVQAHHPMEFLEQVKGIFKALTATKSSSIEVYGPIPATMHKRAGRFRSQLLLQANDRKTLHEPLTKLCLEIEKLKSTRKVRWSIDVDPLDCF